MSVPCRTAKVASLHLPVLLQPPANEPISAPVVQQSSNNNTTPNAIIINSQPLSLQPVPYPFDTTSSGVHQTVRSTEENPPDTPLNLSLTIDQSLYPDLSLQTQQNSGIYPLLLQQNITNHLSYANYVSYLEPNLQQLKGNVELNDKKQLYPTVECIEILA